MNVPTPVVETDAAGDLRLNNYPGRYATATNDPARSLFHTRFLGTQMLQQWVDLQLWDTFLEQHPEIKTVIEFGTGWGAFAVFLLLECIQHEILFKTMDKSTAVLIGNSPVARQLGLASHLYTGDIFGDLRGVIEGLLVMPANHPLMLFCDNGNKAQEMREYAPRLWPGDFLAVHDWGTEVAENDVAGLPLIEIFTAEAEATLARTRFFQRV